MRTEKPLTNRRIHRRAPAVVLGLSLAGLAAQAALADRPAPVTCAVTYQAAGYSTVIIGSVSAAQAVSGSYEMEITSGRSGGRSSIQQSGDFSLAAGTTEILGETQLTGPANAHHVDLTVTVAGRRYACADSL